MSITKLILFDIDGTLLAPGPIGRETLGKCVEEFTGEKTHLEFDHVAGSTDPMIVREALIRQTGLDDIAETLVSAILERYVYLIQTALQANSQIQLLPGSEELVEACKLAGWTVAILTGNMKISANLKLAQCGLVDKFAFGVYGEDGNSRDDLPWVARERAFDCIGTVFDFADMVLIGDTPSDARVANLYNIPSLIVCRRDSADWRQAIVNQKPSWVVNDLCRTEKILDMIKMAPN